MWRLLNRVVRRGPVDLRNLVVEKDRELQKVWKHAQDLDRALQQLNAFVQSQAAAGNSAGGSLRDRRLEALAHPTESLDLGVPHVFVPDIAPTDDDVRIAVRLLRAFHLAAKEERRRSKSPEKDCWAWIKSLQASFFEVLERNDPAALAEYLCNMCRRDATIGTDQGDQEYENLKRDAKHRAAIALRSKDKLVSLAEAVGAIACENPEQGRWGENLALDIEKLVAGIERVIGIDITPPQTDGGMLKLPYSRGFIGERDCHALFSAWSMRRILGRLENASLCEIGAGSGRCAYWSNRLVASRIRFTTCRTSTSFKVTTCSSRFHTIKFVFTASTTMRSSTARRTFFLISAPSKLRLDRSISC